MMTKVLGRIVFSLTLLLAFTSRNIYAVGSIPTPVAKVIARLQKLNSVRMQYVMLRLPLGDTAVRRDTFSLDAWGINQPGKLQVVINGHGHPKYYRNHIYASIAPTVKKVWYDTIADSDLLSRIGWEVYTPSFNQASRLLSLFRSDIPLRMFDTVVGSRRVHGYAFTSPIDDPTDTMIGPTVRTYLIDDDSNLVAYSAGGIAFHTWTWDGAELLNARYNILAACDLDHEIDSMEAFTLKGGYGTFEHNTQAAYLASLPKQGTVISFEGKTPEGEAIALHDVHSKLIVLDFWYAGCPYCRYAMPFLRTMQSKYGVNGLTIVGVNTSDDAPASVEHVVQTEALKNPEIMAAHEVADSLGVKLWPTFIFLDQDDHVLSCIDGYEKSDEPKMEGMIQTYLKNAE